MQSGNEQRTLTVLTGINLLSLSLLINIRSISCKRAITVCFKYAMIYCTLTMFIIESGAKMFRQNININKLANQKVRICIRDVFLGEVEGCYCLCFYRKCMFQITYYLMTMYIYVTYYLITIEIVPLSLIKVETTSQRPTIIV